LSGGAKTGVAGKKALATFRFDSRDRFFFYPAM